MNLKEQVINCMETKEKIEDIQFEFTKEYKKDFREKLEEMEKCYGM